MGAPGVCVGAFASIRQARERMCAEASLHTSRLCEPSCHQVSRAPLEYPGSILVASMSLPRDPDAPTTAT